MKLNRLLLSPAGSADDNTAGGGGVQGREPGSVDNRLSLNPSDPKWADKIDAWEDGQKYTVTLTVTQLSPGEFEVEDVSDAKPYEEGAGDEAAGPEEAGEVQNSTDGNPAMKKLMGE